MPEARIVDVEERTFEAEVLERSHQSAVLVDFWAPWCAPCRTLGPMLERIAAEHPSDLVLAKVDVDRSPELARRFGVRSVPSVVGFLEGAIAGEFEGAQPEPVVRRFVAALLPTEADRRAREGEERAAASDPDGAEVCFRAALEADVRHCGALLGLARLLGARDEIDEALELLDRIAPGTPQVAEAERLAAARDPSNLAARLALGRSLARAGRHEEALEQLLEVVKRDADFSDQAARKAMLDLFAVLGPEDDLAARYRAELARALFR
jgi:putative thioredoxin